MKQLSINNQESGFALLLTVSVLGIVALVLVTTLLLTNSVSLQTASSVQTGTRAQAVALACAEEALLKVREEVNFTGGDSLAFNSSECTYTVYDTGGNNRRIEVSGSADTAVYELEIILSALRPALEVDSWEVVNN